MLQRHGALLHRADGWTLSDSNRSASLQGKNATVTSQGPYSFWQIVLASVNSIWLAIENVIAVTLPGVHLDVQLVKVDTLGGCHDLFGLSVLRSVFAVTFQHVDNVGLEPTLRVCHTRVLPLTLIARGDRRDLNPHLPRPQRGAFSSYATVTAEAEGFEPPRLFRAQPFSRRCTAPMAVLPGESYAGTAPANNCFAGSPVHLLGHSSKRRTRDSNPHRLSHP